MQRHPKNPILTRRDIPPVPPLCIDVSSVFNPGAIKFAGRYYLMLRVQSRSRETFMMTAESANGTEFTVAEEIAAFKGISAT
jgi:predicted GH43/DUF377 family glycosyl hydrolase